MSSRRKLAALTAAVLAPVLLIALSMSLVLAGEDEFDVEVNKWGTESYVIAGEDFTYNVRVWNLDSGVTATNVLVTDTLPPEVEYVVDPNGCSENSPAVLTCPLDDMSPGEQTYFDITVHIAADAYDPEDPKIWNLIEVSATTELGGGDTQDWNNMVNRGLDIQEQADLTMEKAVFPGDVVPVGEWFSYTLRAENLGPSTSRYPVMMDWFATDGSLSMIADDDGACGPMPTDQGWAETPAWLMTWVNSICSLFDVPFCGDPLDWVPVWWYYWYTNFPPTYPYPLAVDWMCVWPLWDGEMGPGEQISRTVSVLPLDTQTIYNQAWVLPEMYPVFDWEEYGMEFEYEFYGTPDPDLLNNVDELVTQVTDEADLSVVKFSKPDDHVDAGLPFTYTIFVENLGPAHAQKVSIRDEILSSGEFEIREVIFDRETEGPIYLASPVGGTTIEFHLHQPLEPKGADNQGRWVIQLVLRAQETQDVNNLVQVFTREGGTFDPDLSNNEDEDSITVGDVADLGIEKWREEWWPEGWPGEDAPYTLEDCYLQDELFNLSGVRAGCPFKYGIVVSNTGPSLARNVVLEDVLPAGVTVDHVDAPGSCTTGIPGDPSSPLTCNLGKIPPLEQREIAIFVWTDPNLMWGSLENDAMVSSDTYDRGNDNNRSQAAIGVEPYSYLYLHKEGPDEIMAGEQIEYWIKLQNRGPSTAHDVYLRDDLLGGVSPLSVEVMIGGGSCAPDSTLCSLGDMPPGDNRGIRVRGHVEPGLEEGTVVTNTVEAWAHTSPFTFTIPITPSVETSVLSRANLSIRKTSDPYKVYAGEQKRYDIEVTNLGPSVAYSVTVTDTLPPGVEFELATIGCDYHPPTMLGSTQPWWFDEEDEDGENGGALFSVDLGSGAGSLIGQMPEWLAAEIEYDNTTGRLFAAEGFHPWYGDTRPPRLYQLDPLTGAEIGYVELDEDCALPGLEFVDGTLYGMCSEDPGGDPYLATIDPDTGDVTKVDEYAYVDNLIHGLAYDESSGIMYGLEAHEGSDNELWEIHLGDGDAYPVCHIVESHDFYYEDVHDLRSIEFGPDGLLYGGMAGYESGLVRIDIDDGHCEITRIGDPGFYATGLTWVEGSQSAVCPLDNIPPGETRNFSIFVRVKPDTLGMINNRVDVTTETYDTDPNNNWDTEANLVLGKADLKVTKFGKPDGEVRAGEELEYWVVVDNLGPGYAHDVVLYDLISSDGHFRVWWGEHERDGDGDGEEYSCQVSGSDCYCWEDGCWCREDAQLTCRLNHPLPVMTPASPGRWLLKVWVEAQEEQSINNLARVVSNDFDPDLSNNEAIAEHEITAVADLDLEKVAWGEVLVGCDQTPHWEGEVAAGGELEYTLYIENEGPSDAENVVVEDWGLSPFLDIWDVECEKDDGWRQCSCNLSGLGELGDTDRHFVCYLGEIDDDDRDMITIRARIPSDVPEGTRLVNDARVYSDVFDDDNGDNLDYNWTYVIATADLGVEKSQEPETTLPGLEVVYTIRVDNWGPSDAHGVLISDTLPFTPTTMTVEGCASDGGQCDVPCEVPTCPAGECPWPDVDFVAQADIPAGEHVIYTLTAIPEWVPCEPITNTAQVGFAPGFDDIDPCDCEECDGKDFAYTVSDPECNFVPLVLKSFPGPDSPL